MRNQTRCTLVINQAFIATLYQRPNACLARVESEVGTFRAALVQSYWRQPESYLSPT